MAYMAEFVQDTIPFSGAKNRGFKVDGVPDCTYYNMSTKSDGTKACYKKLTVPTGVKEAPCTMKKECVAKLKAKPPEPQDRAVVFYKNGTKLEVFGGAWVTATGKVNMDALGIEKAWVPAGKFLCMRNSGSGRGCGGSYGVVGFDGGRWVTKFAGNDVDWNTVDDMRLVQARSDRNYRLACCA